ncbi:hypothetical protein ITJ88_13995 [Exiguobacterium sp. TBG-PICH-001]|uniref:hypothetical protein n=1 Tax=Exiguobacterium abrahamii TaxID=2785532 RepID=UPI0018A7B04C|nr:hypothetical protein [Exiguobacterium sp. TBG-PICH-001]MBF8154391.1 hypothetical protein [Exiguobacterium sp. TBG-PICH-001]
MYRNRSPNLFIILMILLATSFPIPHSHATTEEFEIPDPLTSSFCEETLNDPKKKDLLEKEEIEQCEELVEVEKTPSTESEVLPTPETPQTESKDPPTPETPPTESEDPPTPETPPTESEDPLTPETPPTESEAPPAPETPPTESEAPPAPETPPTESEAPSTPETLPTGSEDPSIPETPPTENEDPSTSETAPDEADNEVPEQLESEESSSEITAPVLKPIEPRQEKQQAVAPTLAGVALLGRSSLDAAYNATTQTITLENTVSGLLNLNLSSGYIIFRLPKEVMQSIETDSVKLQYRYGGLLGIGSTRDVPASFDSTNNQLYADVSALLKLSLLSSDRFTLSFKVGNLPVGVDKTYTFRSELADGLIDLNLLSNGSATATLGIGPTFNLTVPSTLDFGSHELTGGEKIIPRLSPMTIGISHENATDYLWKLQARLSRPLTSTKNDILTDVLYFKTSTTKQLLQDTAIEVAAGKMGATSSPISLTYAPDEGIVLDLTGKYPKPLSYSADIQWSLINAP